MYNPNVCTPTMFEDELRALSTMTPFSDPEIDARRRAVAELRKAIQAVREIPGWSGDSTSSADALLQRMEKNAEKIDTALSDLANGLRNAADAAAGDASVALRGLPSASAEGFLADAGRGLAGITDGWGALDTGDMVAQEEARLAAERETAAMNELKKIRGSLTGEAVHSFGTTPSVGIDTSSVPLPVIDVDGIDSRVPAVGSNAPSGGPGTSPQGTGVGTLIPPSAGTWTPEGVGSGNGGSGSGNGGSGGGNGSGGNGGSGGGSTPSVDSPSGGTLPGYPGGGGGGGLLAGGSGGSGTLGAAVVGGAGAATLMGARSASLSSAGGAGLFGGGGSAGAGAATAGRGLLGMNGATAPGGFGAGGPVSSSGAGATGGSSAGAGGRSMAPGMMGGTAGDDEKRRDRSGLGGPIAPKLEDDEETAPRSRSAQAGSRDSLR